MGEVKLDWIECGYNSCRNCKNKCREYLDANNVDVNKEVIADGKESRRQT